jgi:hypothetical protein
LGQADVGADIQRQAGDLAVTAEDYTSGRVTGLEGQRDAHHGVAAGLAGGRGSHTLEAATGVGHVGPSAGDLIRIRVPHAGIEFPTRLLLTIFNCGSY